MDCKDETVYNERDTSNQRKQVTVLIWTGKHLLGARG